MKIKNIEAFREKLFKNLKELYLSGCDIRELLKVEIDKRNIIRPENKEGAFIRSLNNPLQIRKYHYEGFKEVTDGFMYMKVYEDSITFYKYDPETQSYKWFTDLDFELEPNQTVLMMDVVIRIADFVRNR